jgi:hypothetical protein
VKRRHKASPHIHWHDFYAQAKAEAAANPASVKVTMRTQYKLFNGDRRAYRAWYYRTQQACKALPLSEQNWPEFFAKARDVEMRRQGIIPPNVVPLNPKPTLAGTSSSKSEPQGSAPSMDVEDGRLMFDFSLPEDQTE